MPERVGAIIPAAGFSTRMGGEDKIFTNLSGKPMLAWCVDTLEQCRMVTEIVVALGPGALRLGEELSLSRGWQKTRFCAGGSRRQDSVGNALRAMSPVDWVIVHDGDRPFLTANLVKNGLQAARETGVVVAAVPVKDTIKVAGESGEVVQTLDRSTLRMVQTPQVFRADILRRVHETASDTVTDDAMLAEQIGCTVRMYEGSYTNLKVTTPDDLLAARAIAATWGGKG